MPVISTPEQLLTELGNSAFSTDPIKDIQQRGFTLSDGLNGELKTAQAAKPLSGLPSGVTRASFKGALTFQASPPPLVPAPPAPNGYDVVAGISLAAANEALGAVYESGTIPHEIALDQLLSPTTLTELGGFFKVDRPGGQISRLHITAAPTLTSIADGSAVVAVQIPIQLDWNRVSMLVGRPILQTVTNAIGTLELTMSLVANVISRPETSSSTMTIEIQLLTDVTASNSPRLTLAPASPVQLTSPVPADQIDGTAVLIQNAIEQQFKSSLSWAVSPQVALPIGNLEIRHVDVVTSAAVLIAGVQVVGTQGIANPSSLTNLLPNDASNIFVQVQEVVANLLIQNNIGALSQAAIEQYDNAVVDSASVSFQNNSLVVQVKGRLVDECPLSVDLAFIYTRTVTIKLEGSSIEIDQTDDTSVLEASNLWCVLTTLGLIGLAVVGGLFVQGVTLAIGAGLLTFVATDVGSLTLDKVVNGIFGSGGGIAPVIVDLLSPIPGSDYLPTLSAGYFQVTGGAMLVAASAALQLDTTNTVIYVRFLVPDGPTIYATKPLAGVPVELMDQDAPAPAGDDATTAVPADTAEKLGHSNTASETKYHFEPPTSDQTLAQGQTDLDGIVRFALLANNDTNQLATTAGEVVGVTTLTNLTTGKTISTSTSRTGEPEAKPDLYFRVTMPDGSVVDTRNLPGGFMLNFTSSRLGTLANPLTFGLGGAIVGPVAADPI